MKDEYGYDCACGKHHHYPPYVIAHQNVELVHTCECGRKNSILGLVAEIGNLPNNSVHADAGDSAASTSSLQASADTTSQTVTKRTQRG